MHQTLYRKYRPKKFSDLFGQDHIKAVLQGSLISNKIGHAFLFAGPRGTGKTTTARIFAQAINCKNPLEAEPCLSCEFCQLILNDQVVDVVEIDAASHRGIDEIRELRQRINFPPHLLTRKVYIIDEVHMLTNESFNALLKTLEEPPEYSIFILATTEPHKVPLTIKSRTQQLNFVLGSTDQISAYLKKISGIEEILITNEALKLIAETADGGFRDAASLLEQVSNHSKQIDEKVVRRILGLAEAKAVSDIGQAVLAGDGLKVMALLEGLQNQAVNASFVHKLLVEFFRRSLKEALTILPKNSESNVQLEQVVKILQQLIDITPQLKTSPLPYLPIEIALAKHSFPQQPFDSSSTFLDSARNKPLGVVQGKPSSSWPKVLAELEPVNHSISYMLKNAVVEEISNDKISVSVRYKFHADRVMETKNRQLIETAIEKIFGKKLIFICQSSLPSNSSPSSPSLPSFSDDLAQAAEEILGV